MAGDEPMSASAACRILTVSTSREQALALVRRVKGLAQRDEGSAPAPAAEHIPWTISNKYYAADVHFAPHAVHGLSPHRVRAVPALVFTWAHGEAYKHHIRRLARDLDGCAPEVCLAVRQDAAGDIAPEDRADADELREEEGAIDEFLAAHGFEFVDASGSGASGRATPRADSTGIPRLPRVVDALSTIMWPSMQPRAARSLDWTQGSPDTSLALDTSLESLSPDPPTSLTSPLYPPPTPDAHRLHREMAALERWLETDDFDFDDDPWRFGASAGGAAGGVSSPLSEESLSAFGARTPGAAQTAGAGQSPAGFDDDFTVFVSAPPQEARDAPRPDPDTSFESHASLESTADASFASQASFTAHTSFDAPFPFPFDSTRSRSNSLAPHAAGPFYHSLGSVSDFGDEQLPGAHDTSAQDTHDASVHGAHDVLPSDDEDEDLPSRAEIREASARIFGPPSGAHAQPTTSSADPSSGADPSSPSPAPFDLSRVLDALQGMKAEIAGMADEGERRRAAARVALGLVYGLEAEGSGREAGAE
ncbi:hypothetical protein HDZ31DRAFT_43612 [Schizophyllum fasciatum]